MRPGDGVGTLAWNGNRHLELYYAMADIGSVVHTINPRLFEEQIGYIIDQTEDRLLLVDLTFVSLVKALLPRLAHRPDAVVAMTDRVHLPPSVRLPARIELHCYEDFVAEADEDFSWPEIDEATVAGLCLSRARAAAHCHRQAAQCRPARVVRPPLRERRRHHRSSGQTLERVMDCHPRP